MPDVVQVLRALGIVVVAAPLLLIIVLGITSLVGRKLSEEATSRLGHATIVAGLLAAIIILGMMLAFDTRYVPIELGNWVVIPHHYHFSMKIVFDRLSVPFAIL